MNDLSNWAAAGAAGRLRVIRIAPTEGMIAPNTSRLVGMSEGAAPAAGSHETGFTPTRRGSRASRTRRCRRSGGAGEAIA